MKMFLGKVPNMLYLVRDNEEYDKYDDSAWKITELTVILETD